MYLRTREGEAVSGVALLATLYAPNGTIVDESLIYVTLGEATYTYKLPISSSQGVWKLEVRVGSQLLATYYFRVEVPPIILIPSSMPYEIPIGSRIPLSFKLANTINSSIAVSIKMTVFSGDRLIRTSQIDTVLPPSSITDIDSPELQIVTSNWSAGPYDLQLEISAGNITLTATHRVFLVQPKIYSNVQLRNKTTGYQLLVTVAHELSTPIGIEVLWSIPEASVSGRKAFTALPLAETSEEIPLEIELPPPGSYRVKVVVRADGKYLNTTWLEISVLRKLLIEVALQPARIAKVKVLDAISREPVRGAEVVARYPNGTTIVYYTDSKGAVYMPVASGLHNLTVSKSGYMRSAITFTVAPSPKPSPTPTITPPTELTPTASPREQLSPPSASTLQPEGEEGIKAATVMMLATMLAVVIAIVAYAIRLRRKKAIEEAIREVPEV